MKSTVTSPDARGLSVPNLTLVSKTLDFEGALELLDNSVKLYQEVVQSYFQDIASLPSRMDELLRKSDLSEAVRALHTCKGASLTVGAKLLSELCRQYEVKLKALRQNSEPLDDSARQAMLKEMESAVANTRHAITEVLGSMRSQNSSKAAPDINTRALVEDLISLRNLLARSDMRAIARHRAICALHSSATDKLQTLAPTLKIFDFAKAVVQCDELISDFSAPKQT